MAVSAHSAGQQVTWIKARLSSGALSYTRFVPNGLDPRATHLMRAGFQDLGKITNRRRRSEAPLPPCSIQHLYGDTHALTVVVHNRLESTMHELPGRSHMQKNDSGSAAVRPRTLRTRSRALTVARERAVSMLNNTRSFPKETVSQCICRRVILKLISSLRFLSPLPVRRQYGSEN